MNDRNVYSFFRFRNINVGERSYCSKSARTTIQLKNVFIILLDFTKVFWAWLSVFYVTELRFLS